MNYEFNPQGMYDMSAAPAPAKKKVQQKLIPFIKLRRYFLIFTAVCFVIGLLLLSFTHAWYTLLLSAAFLALGYGTSMSTIQTIAVKLSSSSLRF